MPFRGPRGSRRSLRALRGLACALAPAVALIASVADAEDEGRPPPAPPFALAWTAPADCTARPDVVSLVGDTPGAAAVVIAPLGVRWRLTVTFTAPVQGQRTLDAGTCEEAAEAARLLLRLGARGVLPADVPLVAAEPPPPEPAPAPTPPPPTPFFLSLSALAGAQAFALPGVSPRFGAQAWFGPDPWNVVVVLGTGLASRFPGGPSADAGVEVTPVLDGVVAACVAHQWPALRLAGCADLQAAWWRLRGLNVTDPRSGDAALLAAGAAGRLLVPLGHRFAVTASLAVRPTIIKPRATFAGYGSALDAGPVLAELDVGLGARW